MQAVKNLVSELRELKDAAASHNLHSDTPEEVHSGDSPKPAPTAASNPTDLKHAHIPPPPPRDLPHGWTARYDEKEKKYAYSHGVTAQEQWEFPKSTNELPQLQPVPKDRKKSIVGNKAKGDEVKLPAAIGVKTDEKKSDAVPGLSEEMVAEGLD